MVASVRVDRCDGGSISFSLCRLFKEKIIVSVMLSFAGLGVGLGVDAAIV